MIDCMIIGDSIAVGVSMVRKECVSYSKGGWNSWQWNKDYLNKASSKPFDTIIISLGANDHKGVKTETEDVGSLGMSNARGSISLAAVEAICP